MKVVVTCMMGYRDFCKFCRYYIAVTQSLELEVVAYRQYGRHLPAFQAKQALLHLSAQARGTFASVAPWVSIHLNRKPSKRKER